MGAARRLAVRWTGGGCATPGLWWLGYRDAAQMAGVGPGAVTVAASLAAWLPGPAAIALSAVALSVPVWLAWYWLVRRA